MSKRAFSEIRDVKVFFNASEGVDIVSQTAQEAMSIDAYKAAIGKVEELESAFYKNPSLANLTDKLIVFTGTSRYKLYSFQLTTVFANAEYTFVWNETVPNAEGLS